jgi:hypothetical protein
VPRRTKRAVFSGLPVSVQHNTRVATATESHPKTPARTANYNSVWNEGLPRCRNSAEESSRPSHRTFWLDPVLGHHDQDCTSCCSKRIDSSAGVFALLTLARCACTLQQEGETVTGTQILLSLEIHEGLNRDLQG